MTTRAKDAKCGTCGEAFKRKWARQRKCGACRYSNTYRCAMCDQVYERQDDVKVCAACLQNLKPPETEDVGEWDHHLSIIGHSTTRGADIGPARILLATEWPQIAAIEAAHANPEDEMIGAELLHWFLSGSSYGVAQQLGLTREAVQELRSEFLRVDRAEVEAARIALGYSAEDWQRRKLGLALVKAKATSMRRSLMAA
jgi:hypothetical protein